MVGGTPIDEVIRGFEATGNWLLVASNYLLAAGFWRLAVGKWLLALMQIKSEFRGRKRIGYLLLENGFLVLNILLVVSTCSLASR